ncbi:MAG: spore germination protein [Heliobacteriaceae bacterium]|nr:spore germination protein [Heliobacteriaceae bacterium]MDD4588038.1 spore germination protein [Heliobacteriaceae bacterium]
MHYRHSKKTNRRNTRVSSPQNNRPGGPAISQTRNNRDLFSPDLSGNLSQLRTIFGPAADITFKEFCLGGQVPAGLIFLAGATNTRVIEESLLKSLLQPDILTATNTGTGAGLTEQLLQLSLPVTEIIPCPEVPKAVQAVLDGQALLLVQGMPNALVAETADWQGRQVGEPLAETVIRGPQEGFTETLTRNITLLRRKIKSPQLKVETLRLGRYSGTQLALLFIEGLTDPRLPAEARFRLGKIEIDGILDSGMLQEFLCDNPYTLFPTITPVERPDTVAAGLLEGRIAILVDGSPFALVVPTVLTDFLQSSEDYYACPIPASLLRLLRWVSFLLVLTLPALYVAITTFHQELVPTTLLISLAAQRETVPYPALVEVILMEITFEVLREAGIRLPRPAGQAVSIVGALVIGQAAVNAGLVSPAMVIIVSLTGITSFVIPHFNFSIAARTARFPMIFLGATLGLFGVVLGLTFLLVHLASLRSFGVPYLYPFGPLDLTGLKDAPVRFPWFMLTKRPRLAAENKTFRVSPGDRPAPPPPKNKP